MSTRHHVVTRRARWNLLLNPSDVISRKFAPHPLLLTIGRSSRLSGGGCRSSDSGDCRLPDIREDQTPACEPLPSDRSLCPLAAQKTKNQPRYLRPAMKTWRILRRRGALETPLASFSSPAAPSLSSCCLTYLTPRPSPTPSSVPQPSVQTVHSDRSVIVTSSGYFFIVNVWFVFGQQGDFLQKHFFFLFSVLCPVHRAVIR